MAERLVEGRKQERGRRARLEEPLVGQQVAAGWQLVSGGQLERLKEPEPAQLGLEPVEELAAVVEGQLEQLAQPELVVEVVPVGQLELELVAAVAAME